MDMQLLIAQWSGTSPPGFVRPAILDTGPPRCQHKRCPRKVAIKKDGTPAKACSRCLTRRAASCRRSHRRRSDRRVRGQARQGASREQPRHRRLALNAEKLVMPSGTREALERGPLRHFYSALHLSHLPPSSAIKLSLTPGNDPGLMDGGVLVARIPSFSAGLARTYISVVLMSA